MKKTNKDKKETKIGSVTPGRDDNYALHGTFHSSSTPQSKWNWSKAQFDREQNQL